MQEIKQERHNKSNDARVVFGLILVVLGGFFLLDSMGVIDFDVARIIFSFPGLMMIFGLVLLLNTSRRLLGSILLILGVIFTLPKLFPWIYFDRHLIFPLLLIALGIYIILKKRKTVFREQERSEQPGPEKDRYERNEPGGSSRRRRSEDINTDRIDDISIFGGGHKLYHSENFMGGNVTAIFGGSEIDLRQCRLADGKNVLDIVAVFGGTTVIVPGDWHVVIDVLPVFGGFSNNIKRDPDSVIDTERSLIIKGFVFLGGGEVKS